MEYYSLKIRYIRERFYIWISADSGDGFLTDEERIVSFGCESDLEQYCREKDIVLADEHSAMQIMNEEELLALLKKGRVIQFCREFLNLWNLALDLDHSLTGINPWLNGCHRLYDKVFYGNNLEVFRAEDDRLYAPHFTKRERRQILEVVGEMYTVFARTL